MTPPTGAGEGPPPLLEVPYRSQLLASLLALIDQWNSPAFHPRSVVEVEGDLGTSAARAVGRLAARGPLRPSALADEMSTGASNISKIVRQLEDHGLVVRQADPLDQRAVLLVLTDAGREIAAKLFAAHDAVVDGILHGWSDDDLRTYTELTRRFTADARRFVLGDAARASAE